MRLLTYMLFFFVLYFSFPIFGQAKVTVSGENAVLMEQSSGRVLFEKNSHEKETIASITKIMTAIIAIESGKLKETTTVSRRSIHTEGSSIYLEQGEKVTINDLVYGLMLRSGNDAAVSISEHIGGSVEGFVHLMNEKAQWLGMTNTHFDNPHGLDSENHYSTAFDMATLMRYAMQNEEFQQVSGSSSYQANNRTYPWKNKNKLLTYYDYCTGGKTGFTKSAGRTLVSTAHKNNMNLIAVTLDASDDWRDHMNMYEWGFENFKLESIQEKGKQRYLMNGTNDIETGYLMTDIDYPLTEHEQSTLHKESVLFNEELVDQEIIGKSIVYINSMPVIDVPIYNSNHLNNRHNFISEIKLTIKKISGLY